MLGKVGLFAAWFVVIAAFGWLIQVAPKWVAENLSGLGKALAGEALQWSVVVFPFFSIWLLTGKFHVVAVLSILVGARLFYWLVLALKRMFMGQARIDEAQRHTRLLIAIDPDIARFYRIMEKLQLAMGVLMIVAFAISHFSFERAQAADYMLRYMLYTLPIQLALLGNLPNLVFLKRSHIDERYREHLLVDQTAMLLPVFMSVMLAVYLLHPGAIQSKVPVMGLNPPFYLVVALIAFACFLLLVIAPYAWGVHHGRRARIGLLKEQRQAARGVADALFKGYWQGERDVVAQALRDVLRQVKTLRTKHAAIERMEQLEKEGVTPVYAEDLKRMLATDPRLRLHAFLTETAGYLRLAEETVANKSNFVVERQVLDHVILRSMHAIAQTGEQADATERTRPALFGLIAILLGGIASSLLSILAKSLLEIVVEIMKLVS